MRPSQLLSSHPYLHVDLLESRDMVSDFAKGETTDAGRCPDTHQQHPFLLRVLELLRDKAHLTQGERRNVKALVRGGSMAQPTNMLTT